MWTSRRSASSPTASRSGPTVSSGWNCTRSRNPRQSPDRPVGIDRRSWRIPGRACWKGPGDTGWNRCCLPEYLPKQRWFGGKARRIRATRIADWTLLPDSEAVMVLVEVQYEKGEPETYFLPLGRTFGKDAEQLRENCANAILCPAISEQRPGILARRHLRRARLRARFLSFIEHGEGGSGTKWIDSRSAGRAVSNACAVPKRPSWLRGAAPRSRAIPP